MAHSHPWLTAALTAAMLSLVGMPPLIGFTPKLQLFSATIDAGYAWVAVVAIANTVASLFYYLRVIGRAYFNTDRTKPTLLGSWSAATATLAAAGTIATGLIAGPLIALFT